MVRERAFDALALSWTTKFPKSYHFADELAKVRQGGGENPELPGLDPTMQADMLLPACVPLTLPVQAHIPRSWPLASELPLH